MEPTEWSKLTENEKTLIDVLLHCLPPIAGWRTNEHKGTNAITTVIAHDFGPYVVRAQKVVASDTRQISYDLKIGKDGNELFHLSERESTGGMVGELYGAVQAISDDIARNPF